ncbi:MAG: GIY-YIG nuclease family protein, partial [Chloroflexi bacterium]|nr:GIY-YIG nuclease family protein [Chloroflexota bacterium]
MTGIVYCLENLAMPGLVKIGHTDDIARRLRDLDKTNIPLPFECVVAVEVKDEKQTEQLLHDVFSDHRVRQSREFFEVSADRVRAAFRLTGGSDVTPKSGGVVDDDAKVAVD